MHKAFALFAATMICLAFALPLPASAATYVTYDIPGAKGAGIPQGINKWGTVTGYYTTTSGTYYGFLYQSSGVVTTFSVLASKVSGTYPMGINDSGWIVGYFYDATGLHGFLRNPKYTTLDAPGAGNASGQGTEALSINDLGEIAGVFWDSSSVEHGFVRDASGNYTTFDIPGGSAVMNAVLNQSGEVAGTYNVHTTGANYTYGYVMDATGNITTFDVPGDVYGTSVVGINDSGQVTGTYYPTVNPQEFVRDQFGNITTYNIAGYIWTAGIEDNGSVVGTYKVTNSNTRKGWQMTTGDVLTYFKDPSAGSQGTYPWCVSGNGKIAGYYFDSQGNTHGFVKLN
jgi:hypothetical protein